MITRDFRDVILTDYQRAIDDAYQATLREESIENVLWYLEARQRPLDETEDASLTSEFCKNHASDVYKEKIEHILSYISAKR